MSYQAIVAKLQNVREHPSAQKLLLATCCGSQIVVGIDAYEGQPGIYFPTDGKLSEEYCVANDLFPRYDEEGKKIGGGMFDPKNRRVRAQNLRSVKSDGYFADLDSVAYAIDTSLLYEGFQFDTLNGHMICEKYFTPQTLRAMKGGTKPTRKRNPMMPEHMDTEQFAYKAEQIIVPGSICYVTLKMHGTSHRLAHVVEEVERPKRWYHSLFGITPKTDREWKVIHGTRRVQLGDVPSESGYYGTDQFRYECTDTLAKNLRRGEVFYGEIVGWVNDQTLVMGEVSTKDLRKDPEFKALFNGNVPDTMKYTYNTLPGHCEFYVYRIARADEDGHLVELPWPQVKARCNELGVKHVPDVMDQPLLISDFGYPFDALQDFVESMNDGIDLVDPSHVREGVVVRVETPDGKVHFLKSKGYYFKVLEGIAKAKDDYVDTEEIA